MKCNERFYQKIFNQLSLFFFFVSFFFEDHNNLFSGRVFGALESSVRAHIEDKIITAHIVLPEETYHIEVLYTFHKYQDKY